MRFIRLAAVMGAASTALIPATSAVAQDHSHGHVAAEYTFELLPKTPGDVNAMSALGVNDNGDVVGIVRPTASAQPQQTVYWWRHGDHFHTYALANLEGSQFSRGFDINNSAQIVGEAFNSGGTSIPIRWTGDGAPTHVTNLNEGGTGILNDINNGGAAVGTASGQAVQLNADNTVTTLTAPPGHVAGSAISASSISDDGSIGGRTTIAIPHGDHFHNELRGIVWRSGTATVLDVPAGASSPTITEVTDGGAAYGAATIASKETPVMWEADGTPVVLTIPTIGTYTHARANAATNDEIVVGYASQFAGNTSFGAAAIAWDAHGPVDLNTRVPGLAEGITLQTAADINAHGQIVGTATTPDGPRGFLLTPKGHHEDPSEPDAPHAPDLALEGTNGLRVAWHAPHEDGGAPVLGYSVRLIAGDGTESTRAIDGADVNSTLFENLSPGTYTATVAAVNGVGTSLYSPASNAVTVPAPGGPVTPPAPPAPPVAQPAATTISAARVIQVYGRTARVSVSVAPATSGRVTLRAGARTVSASLTDGRAVLTVPARALRPGAQSATLSYAGADGFAPSQGDVRIIVRKANPVVRARVTPNPVRQGNRATVRITATAAGIRPAGRVVIRVNGTIRGVATLNRAGLATVRIAIGRNARPGTQRITAVYLGSAEVARGSGNTAVRVTR